MKNIFVFLCIFIVPSFSGSVIYSQQKDLLSDQIKELIKTSGVRAFNGVILISKKGKQLFSTAYGYSDFDKKNALKINDRFEIMSNSKQITAVLLLKEVEKGKIDLESPIKKYLPDLTESWADSVTVHQLSNHTHGIIDLEKPLLFPAGSQFNYGNLSYGLIGEIIEKTSKKSYSENAAQIFKQLKMNSTFCFSKNKTNKIVSGHFNTRNVLQVLDSSQISLSSIPANGIVSTANDLAIWNESLHTGKILNPESYRLMINYNVLAQHTLFGTEKIGYGYGIRVNDGIHPKYFGHTGLGDGFTSVNLYFPDSGVSLIVLENQMNENFDLNYYFEKEILDLLMKSNLINKNNN